MYKNSKSSIKNPIYIINKIPTKKYPFIHNCKNLHLQFFVQFLTMVNNIYSIFWVF
jgi:hypothetical protein